MNPKFATRLNSFRTRPELYWGEGHGKPTPLETIERASSVPGLTEVDLNYPDHFQNSTPAEMKVALDRHGLVLNGVAMRYYSDPIFDRGAFTHPDAQVREKAVELTFRGIDALVEMGGDLLTVWPGQDGFEYAFQADYRKLWDYEVEAIQRVAEYNPDIRVSIEYKPDEPRAFSLLPDIGSTLLAIKEAGAPNLGVTLDMAHVLYANEQPAASAVLISRHTNLYGVHLNDAYGKRDDGLMVGSVHTLRTLELLYVLEQLGYDQAIYFDTFPDTTGIDPVQECAMNIETVQRMLKLIHDIDSQKLETILENQDAVAGQRFIQDYLLPPL